MPPFDSLRPASAVLILIAALLAGCGTSSPSPSTPSDLPTAAPSFPGSSGALPWEEITVPGELREGHVAYPDAEELLRAIVAYLVSIRHEGAEVRAGLQGPLGAQITAYGFIWGIGDDAVAGDDYRFTLARDVDGWFVAAMERRLHCLRGVSRDLCV